MMALYFQFIIHKNRWRRSGGRQITRNEVDIFINCSNIEKDAKILDVFCCQGRHSVELYRRGFINVEGIDKSSYLINKALTKTGRTISLLDLKKEMQESFRIMIVILMS